MESHLFREITRKSLDNDLSTMVCNGIVSARDAIALQMLRLTRGYTIPPQVHDTITTSGWSKDGITWYPSEPGTFTSQESINEQK